MSARLVAAQIEGFRRKLLGYNRELKIRVLKKICLGVIMDTPVDTGALQFNWQFSVGSPATGTLGPPYSTAGVVNRVMADIDRLVGEGDEQYHFTNNLHYAQYIEYDGHSAKAPAGMLRINIAKADATIKQAVLGTP